MKKKIIGIMLAFILVLPCAFLLTACGGEKEKPSNEFLDVSGNYEKVNFEEDLVKDPQPEYVQFMQNWAETQIKETAKNYSIEFVLNYNLGEGNGEIKGNLTTKYTDTINFLSFETEINLTIGEDKYTIKGSVKDGKSTFTKTKNGENVEIVVDNMVDSLILSIVAINLPQTAVPSENPEISVAKDNEFIKVQAFGKNTEGEQTVNGTSWFVFDLKGNFVGYKVSILAGEFSYSVQVKLTK